MYFSERIRKMEAADALAIGAASRGAKKDIDKAIKDLTKD